MELDEKLFHFLWKTKKKIFHNKGSSYSLKFESIKERLELISTLLSGNYIKARKGNNIVGLVGNAMYFSTHISLSKDVAINELAYIHQSCFSITAKTHGFTLPYSTTSTPTRLHATLQQFPYILEIMRDKYPALFAKSIKMYSLYIQTKKYYKTTIDTYIIQILERYIAANDYSHKIESSFSDFKKLKNQRLPPFLALIPLEGRIVFHRDDGGIKTRKATEEEKTEVKSEPKDIIKKVDLKENKNANPASILMDGVQTTDVYKGGFKKVDGSDDLDAHKESLENLNIQEVVRSDVETNSIFKANIVYELAQDPNTQNDVETSKQAFYYKEWNYRQRRYLKNWCRVYESKPCFTKSTKNYTDTYLKVLQESNKQINLLTNYLQSIFNSRKWRNRQLSGGEIDIDSVVNGFAAQMSGVSSDEKFYMSKFKNSSNVSILILIDASLSSDSWVKGKRVLDTTKQIAIILQKVFENISSDVALSAFNGKTRNHCRYFMLKNFTESWTDSISNLMAVEPEDYTRIGVEGRDIYIREGCYTCHSQMVRPFRNEVYRYGEYSKSGEFVYDRPFQWGSKRLGPDLHRLGGKFPDFWHYRHMLDPRSTTPGSIMPNYGWLYTDDLDVSLTSRKLSALKKLGTPYTKEQIQNAVADLNKQALAITNNLIEQGVERQDGLEKKEIISMIAYLQRLGTDIKKEGE